jgi:hypothetical protein
MFCICENVLPGSTMFIRCPIPDEVKAVFLWCTDHI